MRLFGVVKSNVSYHLKNIFGTDELDYGATVQKIRTVREDRTRLPRPRIAQARQRALSARAAALDPAEFGILYAIGSRGGFAAQDTGETTNDMARKREEQAKGGVSHGKCDAHTVLVGTYKGDIHRFKEVA